MDSVENEHERTDIRGSISRRLRSRRRTGFGLRMTAMIDVIFLLLIFFLLTARFRPQENFLPISLPAARADTQQFGKIEPLVIYVFTADNGCEVWIGKLQTVLVEDETVGSDLVLLTEKIADVLRAQKRTAGDPVELVCAPDLKWKHLVRVYNTLFGMGVTDVTFRMTD